jgi:hypothetical protein
VAREGGGREARRPAGSALREIVGGALHRTLNSAAPAAM